jgi:hypothetical protein
MRRSQFIKALTLFSSLSLLTAFLLYRTGYFDDYISVTDPGLQTSHNGGVITRAKQDSLASSPALDSAQRSRLFSSKPSPFLKTIIPSKKTVPIQPPVMWSGSKSGIMFQPRTWPKFDTIKFDLKKIRGLKH